MDTPLQDKPTCKTIFYKQKKAGENARTELQIKHQKRKYAKRNDHNKHKRNAQKIHAEIATKKSQYQTRT